MSEYFRPNLFANTPDILHEYLQTGGRPGFQVRAVLAATLGATYGIYSGFELCEHLAVAPGSEEYLDSEKYQFRHRDREAPGNINDLIRRLNGIRRAEPALQYDTTLDFTPTDNAQILAYTKSLAGRGVLVIVNLDPRNVQHGWVTVPLGRLALASDRSYDMEDLLDGGRYRWQGDRAYVRFDPSERVAHVMKPIDR
jgi:starch synthase (maltosyl-transferring)